jgi:hypothetical protein
MDTWGYYIVLNVTLAWNNLLIKLHPTTDEWIKKIWNLYTMEFYLATKNNEMLFAGKWMELRMT